MSDRPNFPPLPKRQVDSRDEWLFLFKVLVFVGIGTAAILLAIGIAASFVDLHTPPLPPGQNLTAEEKGFIYGLKLRRVLGLDT